MALALVQMSVVVDATSHQRRRSQDFWLGGAQTTNHMQCRYQKFSKKELFVGQGYRRMEVQVYLFLPQNSHNINKRFQLTN